MPEVVYYNQEDPNSYVNQQKLANIANSNNSGYVSENDIVNNATNSIISNVTDVLEGVLDSAFLKPVTKDVTDESYRKYLESLSKGLQVKDLRGIMGMPPQFLPSADPRIGEDDIEKEEPGDITQFGRVYAEKIIKYMPLMFVTPGKPSFMAAFKKSQRIATLRGILKNQTEEFENLLSEGSGKYYSLKYDYVSYYGYVNTMLRSAAYFLGIEDEDIGFGKLGTTDYEKFQDKGEDIFGSNGLKKFLGPYAGAIPFYVDAGTDAAESFSNSTTQSELASKINSLSDMGREMNFLIGNVGSNAGLTIDKFTGEGLMENMENLDAMVKGLGSNNIFTNIINKAQTLLAGGRLVFPEIWTDSTFSRSYSCSMKLVSPSGDNLSVFLNILVPVFHLLGLVLPRQSLGGQTYFAPFLVRAYYKGLFNIDMGIITDLGVTYGAECEWTLDGIPTVCSVNFTIKDLYNGLFMSTDTLFVNKIFTNITELDYIATRCGINVNDQEVMRLAKLWGGLKFASITDAVTRGIFRNVAQYFNQKLARIFGVFNGRRV